jgi:3-polyprenyl-4-hydroxybenzoate decarboxylase
LVQQGYDNKIEDFAPYFDRHTSVNISSELEHHLKRLKIHDKTTTITCDGASNIKAAFKSIDARIKRLQCLAHKLHLVVCNSLGLWIKSEKQNNDHEFNGKNRILENIGKNEKNDYSSRISSAMYVRKKRFSLIDCSKISSNYSK